MAHTCISQVVSLEFYTREMVVFHNDITEQRPTILSETLVGKSQTTFGTLLLDFEQKFEQRNLGVDYLQVFTALGEEGNEVAEL